MQPHQERVVTEQQELQDKLDKLTAFMNGTFYVDDLAQDEKDRLFRQHIHMSDYNNVLKERIGAFI